VFYNMCKCCERSAERKQIHFIDLLSGLSSACLNPPAARRVFFAPAGKWFWSRILWQSIQELHYIISSSWVYSAGKFMNVQGEPQNMRELILFVCEKLSLHILHFDK